MDDSSEHEHRITMSISHIFKLLGHVCHCFVALMSKPSMLRCRSWVKVRGDLTIEKVGGLDDVVFNQMAGWGRDSNL
jgi:hypothetical protein